MYHEIIPTQPTDLDHACEMFDAAIAYQKRKGYPQYVTNDREAVAQAIKDKLHFKLMIDGEMACVFNIAHSDKAIWCDREVGNAIYLHRIITDQKYKGKKLFGDVLQWSVAHAKSLGKQFVRLDTWDNNPNLVDYYLSFGFEFVSRFFMPDDVMISENCRGNMVVLLEYKIND